MNIYAFIVHEMTDCLSYTVRKLSEDNNDIVIIHVDKKSEINDFLTLKKENVILITHRIDVCWGGVSQVDATLSLMEMASNYSYKYFFLLSGQCLLVKDKLALDSYLENSDKKCYISFSKEKDSFINPEDRVKYIYPSVVFNKEMSFPKKIVISFWKLMCKLGMCRNARFGSLPRMYKGSNWFTLDKEVVDYIMNYLSVHPNYHQAFKYSFCSDEIFFHTIIANSQYNPESGLSSSCMRYIDWNSGPTYPKEHTFRELISYCSDMDSIFFARKMVGNIEVKGDE